LRRQEQKARRLKERRLDNADEIAWRKSLQATRHLLPKGFTVEMRANGGRLRRMGVEADTQFDKTRIIIEYDPALGNQRDPEKRIGALAQTFTHELAAHAKNARSKESDVEHREMFAPETRAEYLNAARATFRLLDNDVQRQAFANAWGSDMEFQIANSGVDDDGEEDELDAEEKTARRLWGHQRRNSMLDAIDNPSAHGWA
jgi:hypothetical protein